MGLVKVGFCGAGNTGCQIAQLAHVEKDFPVICINTSQKDMVNITADVTKIILGEEKGAGKDRDVSIDYIYENHKEITSQPEVVTFLMQNDIIVVGSSTGGGSGSGIAMALATIFRAYLKEQKVLDKKRILVVHVLPQNKEGYFSQTNTRDYFKDIPANSVVPFVSYDNNKYSNLSPKEVFERVNRDVVHDLCILRGDYVVPTPFESIDEEDLFRVLEIPGRVFFMSAENIKEKDLDNKSIEEMLIENHLRNSSSTEIQHDGNVGSVAVIANLNDKLLKTFDVYNPLPEFIGANDCRPFPHIYTPKEGEANSVYLIFSGMSRITDRFSQVVERISELEFEQKMKKDDGFESLLSGSSAQITRQTISETDDVNDIDAMFSRIRRHK